VAYGTFAADARGDLYPPRDVVRRDFAAMRAAHVDAIRTYTPPPDWLFEEARGTGLRVLVGIYWDCRNCAFDDPRTLRGAEAAVRAAVARCRRFPDVVLAYAIANEIPPLTVRFHGRRVIERFLHRLYGVAKSEDPEGLVTYANYPTTEFLDLGFLDFCLLNVYLLEPREMGGYLDRMLIQVKGKPLVLGEVGDDSMRKGEGSQAALLDWTIPLALDKGCAGVFVFSWTDEWVVGGHRVEDWRFGLVDRERNPKSGLAVVRRRFGESPSARHPRWPRVSVVVCNYNGGATLEETLRSLLDLDYPDFEVIYLDDGSTDRSLDVARRFDGRLRIVRQENRGLSLARNVGAQAATGEIVAYTDSDAFADRDWLRHLVRTLESGAFVACGGPSLAPASDGRTARFIAVSPGNPTVVLRDNVEADHIAGVNMAFRREALLAIGGFDPVHTRAGDDVDIGWRLQDAGMRLGFCPAAIVWHHPRPSIGRYLRQQYGYGEAENQLERKHPERFNLGGYIRWGGRVYGGGFQRTSALFRPFIYHGRLGSAPFQTLYQKDPSYLLFGPSMIHWYFGWILLLALSPLSGWLGAVGGVLLLLSIGVAFVSGWTTEVPGPLGRRETLRKVATVSLLHFLHPLVRWSGRVAPSRRRPALATTPPRTPGVDRRLLRAWARELRHFGPRRKQQRRYWGPGGGDREVLVRELHRELKARGTSVSYGQEWVNWDLSVNGSLLADGRIYTAPEHYDRALCFGFLARTGRFARGALLLLSGAAAFLTWRSAFFLPVWTLPLGLFARIVARRARLRHTAWAAIDAVLERRGARRFERSGA
jgi:GT2 family glycosyltransferase